LHVAVWFGPPAHTVPHAPQLFASERSGVSHPLVALPSQLPYPKPQVKPQVPAVHVGDAFARAGHAPPHTLQFSGFVCRFTSQPSIAEPLQLP
jgi:hypothetical protein